MTPFLDSILAFPTAFFTILMGVTLTYWLCVILGAVGIDVLDGDVDLAAGAKAAGGLLEGGAKAAGGMLEGGAKAASGASRARMLTAMPATITTRTRTARASSARWASRASP